MILEENHPFYLLKDLASNLSYDAEFELSIYEYEPQSILDHREVIRITANQLSKDIIERIISGLPNNNELAIHSSVRINKKLFHIPMIDFVTSEHEILEKINIIRQILPRDIFNEMSFFNSGRSCHAYSLKLIKHADWVSFMGRLLLISKPNETQIIDTRWIGHRLLAGYSSLRWSNNSSHYLAIPQKSRVL
ncbi:primase 1D-like protein [Pseudomonas siliginis]|uniref:primase 1D-like protein n=1 Tax=Pseudomonas siliginis TaxID=2842346 RepID=UPI003F490A26